MWDLFCIRWHRDRSFHFLLSIQFQQCFLFYSYINWVMNNGWNCSCIFAQKKTNKTPSPVLTVYKFTVHFTLEFVEIQHTSEGLQHLPSCTMVSFSWSQLKYHTTAFLLYEMQWNTIFLGTKNNICITLSIWNGSNNNPLQRCTGKLRGQNKHC